MLLLAFIGITVCACACLITSGVSHDRGRVGQGYLLDALAIIFCASLIFIAGILVAQQSL